MRVLMEQLLNDGAGAKEDLPQAVDNLNPFWVQVARKREAVYFMFRLGRQQAEHVTSCEDPDCKCRRVGELEWATPTIFQETVVSKLEEKRSAEAKAWAQEWALREPQQVEVDPRYVAFKVEYDKYLLQVALLRATVRSIEL